MSTEALSLFQIDATSWERTSDTNRQTGYTITIYTTYIYTNDGTMLMIMLMMILMS